MKWQDNPAIQFGIGTLFGLTIGALFVWAFWIVG